MMKNSVILSFEELRNLKQAIRQSRLPEIFVANEVYENKAVLKGYINNRIL